MARLPPPTNTRPVRRAQQHTPLYPHTDPDATHAHTQATSIHTSITEPAAVDGPAMPHGNTASTATATPLPPMFEGLPTANNRPNAHTHVTVTIAVICTGHIATDKAALSHCVGDENGEDTVDDGDAVAVAAALCVKDTGDEGEGVSPPSTKATPLTVPTTAASAISTCSATAAPEGDEDAVDAEAAPPFRIQGVTHAATLTH